MECVSSFKKPGEDFFGIATFASVELGQAGFNVVAQRLSLLEEAERLIQHLSRISKRAAVDRALDELFILG